MYSSAQVVFMFDVNCLDLSLQSVKDVNVHIAAFKLCCLRLLTEFGAQTQNCSDIRWAVKFYDSLIFKPGKTNNSFLDFNRRSYDIFDAEICRKLKVSLKNDHNDDSANSTLQRKAGQSNSNHTACFILNKAIQEALKDYNWDLPDVSSPVNTRKSRNNQQDKSNGIFNGIVVFTKFPQDVQTANQFTGNCALNNPQALAKLFLEKATLQALEESHLFRLFFIETSPTLLNLKEHPVLESLNSLLNQFHGSLLSIGSIVDCSGLILRSSKQQVLLSQKLHFRGLEKSWFSKGRLNRTGRLRKPQPGPTLVWQSDGLTTLKIALKILVLQGRVSHEWQELSVVGSAKASSAAHAAMASLNSQVMLCRQLQPIETPTNAVAFDDVLSALSQFNLVLVLQLTCGGLGLLSPFLGSVGCLTVLSLSGLAQPPLSQFQVEDSLLALATKPLLNFTQAAIKKALHVGGGVAENKAAASLEPGVLGSSTVPSVFKQSMLEPWYCSKPLPHPSVTLTRRNVLSRTQLSILNRAQRRCCPQLSRLVSTSDASKTAICGVKSTAATAVLAPKHSSIQGRHGTGVSDGGFSKPAKTVSRALQLVNKSKIVTAQQKVKEQKDEEEEQEVARERRAQQSSLRSQKSQAIMSSTLSNIQDTTDAATVIQSLINLRDSVSGQSTTDGDSQNCPDVFGVAQTIINLALMHVRSASETATSSTTSADTSSITAANGGVSSCQLLLRSAGVPLGQHCQPDFISESHTAHLLRESEISSDDLKRTTENNCNRIDLQSSKISSIESLKYSLKVGTESDVDQTKDSCRDECENGKLSCMISTLDGMGSINHKNVGASTWNDAHTEMLKCKHISSNNMYSNRRCSSTSSNSAERGSQSYNADSGSSASDTAEALKILHKPRSFEIKVEVTPAKEFQLTIGRETRKKKNTLTLMMSSFKVSVVPNAAVTPNETDFADSVVAKRDGSKTSVQSSKLKKLTPCKVLSYNTLEDLKASQTRSRCFAFVSSNETKVKHSVLAIELREVLSGVMLSSRDISALPKDCQLQQFQLHTLLHLETMWLMGYSSGSEGTTDAVSPEQKRRSAEREGHVEDILRLLRGITLQFNPGLTTSFLNQIVLTNYEDTLPDVLTEIFEELNQPLPPSLAGPLSVNTTLDTPPLQQLASIPSSILSAGSIVGSGGVAGTRRGMRQRSSNMAVVGGGAGRQVIVPGSRMARLTRATSEQQTQGLEKKAGGKSSVRRSLFDNRGPKRSQSAAVTPQRPKRCRGNDKSGEDSPERTAKRMKLSGTPREGRKRRRSALRSEEDYGQPIPNELFTPNKRDLLASPLTPANRRLLSASKGGVLAPGTPAHLLGRTMKHLRSSAGNAVVAESPEIKGKSLLSGRRSATGRSSFYSGARSRNCERARTSLLAQRLQSGCSDKVLSNSNNSGAAKASHTNSANVSASSFLFSKIFASAPPAGVASRVVPKVDRRRSMRRALNFDNVDDVQSKPMSETSPKSKRLTRSTADERSSPIHSITKSFSLRTPTKDRPPFNVCQKSAERKSPCTPKRLMSDNDRLLALGSPGNLTPSKRVQFSLQYTPSKTTSNTCGNTTPKSILKTPTRTPHRQITCRTPRSCDTPSRRPSRQVFRTPRSGVAFSPDLFSCGKSSASVLSPAKTPSKSPVKSAGLTSNKRRQSPLVSYDRSLSHVSPNKRLSKSPKKILHRFDSPSKSRLSSEGKDSIGWSVTASNQQSVVLDHGLDICDDISQGEEKAFRSPGGTDGLTELVSKNNDLPSASIQADISSSDSSIFLSKVSLPPTMGNVNEPINSPEEQKNTMELGLPHSITDANAPCPTPVRNLVQNMDEQCTLNQFFEPFVCTTEKSISQGEIPSFPMDEVLMNTVLNNQAHNDQLPEIPIMSPVNLASHMVSVVDETYYAVNEKLASDENYTTPPLLDIPAILSSEPQTIETNPMWLDTNALDSSFSSPEIEITRTDRDSVKKCILERKKNECETEISYKPNNDRTPVKETKVLVTRENELSCSEENFPSENEAPRNSSVKLSCNSLEAVPKASENSSIPESKSFPPLNSTPLPMERCSNINEVQTVVVPNVQDSYESNNNLSLLKPEFSSMGESRGKIDRNQVSESSVYEILKSDVVKLEGAHANEKVHMSCLKPLRSSSMSPQKSRSKKQKPGEKTPCENITLLDVHDTGKEVPSSPVIKSKSKKKKFHTRCLSVDTSCSFTITDLEVQRVKQGEESQLHETRSKFEEVRRPNRLRRKASNRTLLKYKSRQLPARKSCNTIPNYFEDDDDFSFADGDDESEQFTTRTSFDSLTETNQFQKHARKHNSGTDADEEKKSSAKKDEKEDAKEKENVCIAPRERSQRRARCSKRLINWSDFEEDLDEGSSVDYASKQMKKNQSSTRCKRSRRSSDNQCSSRTNASSGSVFSAGSVQYDQSLGVTPLQNVENFTKGRRPARNRIATSYVDFPSDDSELFAENSLDNAPLDDPPVPMSSNHPQVKIDKYLSPVRRPSSDFQPPVVLETDPSSTSNVRIDWKQTKPVRTREKLLDCSISKASEEFQEPSASTTLSKNKRKRGKKKRVKLKFKKSGDEYQVSRPDVSGESLNTTVSDCHSASQVSCPETEEKKNSRSKKSSNGDSLLTPLRFTRHMSKDLSITPELFQKLVSASPNSKISKPRVSPTKSPKRPLPKIRKLLEAPALTKVASALTSTSKHEDNVWRVESIQGSPTMKTFIRVGNSPSCNKSHLHLASPSLSSMLHLSTSPLINKQKTTREEQKSKTNHTAINLQALTSHHNSSEQRAPNVKHGNASIGELDQPSPDALKSRKRRCSSRDEDGPSLKRLRSTSPVKCVRRRASKKLYE
ncbi:hypothetical protein FHG87_002092 [Trinorchestia longiramus]|nr:hypothetical protein FHG87_002092 [Trinorchestia longiramus]